MVGLKCTHHCKERHDVPCTNTSAAADNSDDHKKCSRHRVMYVSIEGSKITGFNTQINFITKYCI